MTDFKLKYQIVADAAKAKAEVKSFDDLLQGAGSTLGSTFGTATVASAAGIAAMGTAAVGAGVALFNLTKSAADYGSEIYNASVKTGLSAETMSALKLSADRTGVSLESVGTIIGRFSKTIGEAAQGSKEATEKLTRLGIDPKVAIQDLDGALAAAIKQIYAMESPVARATAAQQLFGKAGTELLKVLDDTKGNLPGLIAEAKRLGLTLTNEDARAADEFGDQLDVLKGQLRGVQFAIGKDLMPVFQGMARDISEWLASNPGEIKSWGETFTYWIRYVVSDIQQFKLEWEGLVDLLSTPPDNLLGDPNTQKAIDDYQARSMQRLVKLKAIENLKAGNYIPPSQGQYDELGGMGSAGGFIRPLPGVTPPDYLKDLGGGAKKAKSASTSDNRTDKQVYQDFVAELKKLGVTINSGFRTYAEQASLFARLPRGQAARPGTSDHEFYRAVDLKPGVDQSILERAARAAGVTLGKRNVHEGTGLHNHQSFKKGRMTGGGEETAYEEAVAAREELAEWDRLEREGLRQLADEWIAGEERASSERLSIRQKEADLAVNIMEGMVLRGEMTEQASIETLGQLRLDMLEEEKKELEGQVPTEKNLQRLEELRLEISDQKVENENEVLRINKQLTDEYLKQVGALEKRNQRPGTGTLRTRVPGAAGPGIGAGIAQGMGVELVPIFDAATGAMITFDDRLKMVGADINDFVGNSLGGMIDGLAQMGAAWLTTGQFSTQAALQMVAGAALSIAMQAGMKAIFEVAEGYAMAGLAAMGHPTAGASAAMHFKAAATYGIVAGIAGGVGIAAGLGARAAGGGSGSSGRGGSSSSSSSSSSQEVRPYSRQSDDAYISGQRGNAIDNLAAEIRRLRKMVSTASPGDVLVRGSQQRKGFIGTQAVDDMKTRPQLGSRMLRQANAR